MPPVRKAPSLPLPPSRSAQAVRQSLRWGSKAEELSRSSRTPPSHVRPPQGDVASRARGISIALSRLKRTPRLLPDFSERADRIGEFWGYPESRAFAELLIDCEEDRTLRAVLVGMLREIEP
jgi:hypothetical protein